jgi:retinol dehydrogenase-12
VVHGPARIYLAARNEASARKAISEIEATVPGSASVICYIHCDLASLASVQRAARTFLELEKERVGADGKPRLDLLFLNAGIMAAPAGLTADGYELQFGTNHIGHFLLAKLLLPTLLETSKFITTDVRVITISSFGHWGAPWRGILFESLRTDMWWSFSLTRYAQSKLANILFTKELHRRYHGQGITAVAVNPGLVNTELYRTAIDWWGLGKLVATASWCFPSVEVGTKGQLWAATAPLAADAGKYKKGEGHGKVRSGEYYSSVGIPGLNSPTSNDAGLALKLWDWSEREVEEYIIVDKGSEVSHLHT